MSKKSLCQLRKRILVHNSANIFSKKLRVNCEKSDCSENEIYILTFVHLSYVGVSEMTPHIEFNFFITLFCVDFFQYLEDLLV